MNQILIRPALILALAWTFHGPLAAQKPQAVKEDSLAALLPDAADTSRIDLLIALSEELNTADPGQAFGYGNEALLLAEKSADPLRTGLAHIVIAKVYTLNAIYDKALESMLLSLKQMELLKDTLRIAQCYDYIGYIYMNSENFTDARTYFRKALELNKDIRNHAQICGNYMNMGTNYVMADSIENGLSYYMVSLMIADSLGLEKEKIALLNYIGQGYGLLGKNEDALKHFYKVLELLQPESDDYIRSEAMVNMGRGYLGMKNYPAALKYARQGYSLSKSNRYTQVTCNASRVLSDIYAGQGNYRMSYAFLLEYKNLSDTIMNAEKVAQIARIQTLYELDKKEQENIGLRKENVRGKRWLQTSAIVIAIIASLVLVLGILLYILTKLNNRQLELNKALSAQGKELEELNGQKDRFFSFVAHNLKNPFNTIMGFAELMQRTTDGREPEKARQYASLIFELSSQVQRVLSNLLEWSRLQRRSFETKPEIIELSSLIKDVIEMNTREAARKDIHFNLAARGNLYVSADRSMITIVLQNLVSNAINFTPSAGQISIDCKQRGEDAEVSVTDTGIGISDENLSRLFLFDFSQTKIGSSDSGAGLGLIICHEMIQKNNGSITAESHPGKGSRFTFTLPAVTHDESGELFSGMNNRRDTESSEDLVAAGIVPPEALQEIRAALVLPYEEITKVLSIENLEIFSKTVTDVGEQYGISPLSSFGKTLTRLTRAHKIDQIIKLLPGFNKFLDSLTSQINGVRQGIK